MKVRTSNDGPAPSYHLVGVAGTGMNALAQLLVARGFPVSGSDRYLDRGQELPILDRLAGLGVRLTRQDGTGVRPETTGVVVSTAIEEDNPDLAAARKLARPIIHRAEMIAQLLRGQRCIAVTGTAGKTTVTGMLGWILEGLEVDPTVINGDVLLNWAGEKRVGNIRVGQSDWWVVEADESDRSLLRFAPEWAVITNISKDHFELQPTIELFRDFAGRVTRGVVCGAGVCKLAGFSGEKFDEPVRPPAGDRSDGRFRYRDLDFQIGLPGRHNLENALLAAALCARLDLDLEKVRDRLASFKGIRRRLESVAGGGTVRVIDDYAHNPVKITAAWESLRPMAGRLLGCWRPHGYGPLALMQPELVETFRKVCRKQDRLFILPVYYAGGTARQRMGSEEFVAKLKAEKVPAEFSPDYATLQDRLIREAQSGDVILCMGARDPELPVFARKLAGAFSGADVGDGVIS